MPLEIFVSRRAAREIERVVQWWASNRPAAPGAVRQDLQASLNLLLMQPDIGVRVKEASSPNVRRLHLDRIRSGFTTVCTEIGSKSYRCGIQVGAPILLFNGMTPNNAVDRTPGSAWRRYAVVLVAGAGHGKR